VKEVRWHSKRGKATVAGVVGIVATTPCHGMGVTASVTSWVRALHMGSLVLRRGLGRGGVGARPPEGSGEPGLAPEPWSSWLVCFVFCDLYYFDLGILFMVPNNR